MARIIPKARIILFVPGIILVLWSLGAAQVIAPVRVTAPKIQTISEVVTGHGVLAPSPENDVTISSVSPKRIDSILVKPGESVRRGQLVVVLERDHSQEIAVEKARIKMEQQKVNLERDSTLFTGGVIPEVTLEQARTNYELATSEYALQRKSLAFARKNSELRSPINGYVSQVNGVVGQIADPSQVILRIVNLRSMIAKIGIEVEDIGKIKEGQPADIRIPNVPTGHVYQGVVSKINKEIDPATQLIDIWIDLKNPNGLLQPGMFADALISVRTDPQALTVPLSAVLSDSLGSYVYTVQDSSARKAYIHSGIRADSLVQVVSGLHPGESVVYQGNYELQDSMQVRIHKPVRQ